MTTKHTVEENPAIARMYRVVFGDANTPPRELTVAEWQDTYDAFEKFHYSSAAARSADMNSVVLHGLLCFWSYRLWRECLALAERALADPHYAPDFINGLETAHFCKALSLIETGRIETALAGYLEYMATITRRSHRRIAFGCGRVLITAIHPGGDAPTPADLAQTIDERALHFARAITALHYGHRKLPIILRAENPSLEYSWAQVRDALNKL